MDQFASGNFMCVCLPPRSGSHVGGQPPECDAEDNDDESMDIWWIIIASVLGSMMLVCIVVTVLYWRAKKDLEHRRDTGYKEFSHQIDEDEMGTQNSEPAVNGGKRTGRDVELDAESFGEQSLNKIAVAPIPDDCPSLMSFRKLPIENPNDVSVEKDVFSDVASNANYVELNNASMNGTQHNQMFSPLASFGSFAMRRGSPAGLQSRRQSLLSGSDVSPRLDASPSPRGFDGSPRLDASLPPLGQTALSSSSPRHQASRRPSAAPSANFDPPITYLDI
ncbi:hypothetical protein DIPPA_11477 [Diplonema papillatum]|nr:hypothetical protein DIPPA_11477 [Diplonema papillatum]